VSAKNIAFFLGLLGADNTHLRLRTKIFWNRFTVASTCCHRELRFREEIRMRSIKWDEWTLNRLIPRWANELADGTTEANLWTGVIRTFKDGLFDHGGALSNGPRYVLIDKFGAPVLPRKDPRRWLFLRPLGDRIVLSKEAVNDLARYCNRSPPSWYSDETKGPSQPSRSPEYSPPAPEAMIKVEIRFEYQRAAAAGEKPPNVKEVLSPVQRNLQQKGYWASKRRIQKLAEDPEFKCLRLPPGKRWSKPGKK
jgi:hypothetical protein